CIVHLVRAALNYVPWKYRKLVAADLRRIYQAATAEEARQQLEEMILKWTAYPSVGQVWQRNWDRITPFFHYPADISKAIYNTNNKIKVVYTEDWTHPAHVKYPPGDYSYCACSRLYSRDYAH